MLLSKSAILDSFMAAVCHKLQRKANLVQALNKSDEYIYTTGVVAEGACVLQRGEGNFDGLSMRLDTY